MAGFWDWLFGGGKKETPAPRREAPSQRRGGGGSFEAPAPRQQAAPQQQAGPVNQGGGWSNFFNQGPVNQGGPRPMMQQRPMQQFNMEGLPRGGGGRGGMFAATAPAVTAQVDETAEAEEQPENKQADEKGEVNFWEKLFAPGARDDKKPSNEKTDPAFKQDKDNTTKDTSAERKWMFGSSDSEANFWDFVLKTPTLGTPTPGGKWVLPDKNPVQKQVAGGIRAEGEKIESRKTKDDYAASLGNLTLDDSGRLTWDQYNALTPLQRSAVDANEAILQAIEADKADAGKGAVTNDTWDYDQTVKRLFGAEGGSDTYAPRTVKLLDELGLTDTKRGDLDNYLTGGALISTDDLAGLGADALPALQQRAVEDRTDRENNALAFSGLASARAADTLSAGQSLLDTLNSESGPAVGFNPVDDTGLTQSLDELYQILGHRNSAELPPDLISAGYAELEGQYGVTREDIRQYFDKRLQRTEASSASGNPINIIGTTEGDFLNPEEFRARYYDGGK